MDDLLIIGYHLNGTPIFGVRGSDGDDEDDVDLDEDDDDDDATDDDDDDNSDDDGDDDDAGDKKVVGPKKGERDPHEKGPNFDVTLERERAARKKAERRLAALRKQHETDAEKSQREAEEAASRKYKPVAIRSSVRAALKDAGFDGDVKAGLRLIDMDEVDIDDDGDVTGLNEQIELMKAEFPRLFTSDDEDEDEDDTASRRRSRARAATAAKAPRADAGKKRPARNAAPKSSAEKLASLYESGR